MLLDGGLIGCGFFAQNHLNAWRDLSARDPGARIVAVCDTDPAKAQAAAERFGIPRWYRDAAEMLDRERLGFVDIATTMGSHRALAELAASRRVPMIVQKPFAPTWEDCLAIVRAAEAAGVPLMVHENFRFQVPMRRAHAALAAGEIGEPVWARISFRSGYDVYANQPYFTTERELIVLDLGIHLLDLARFFLGEVERIACEVQQVRPGLVGEDMATMLLRHASGAVSVVDCTYESRQLPDPFPQTLLHVEGRQGCLRVFQGFEMQVDRADGTSRREHVGSPPLAWTSEPWHVAQESVLGTQAHWVECLATGRTPATSGRDNLRTYALVRAAYEAARWRRAEAPATAP